MWRGRGVDDDQCVEHLREPAPFGCCTAEQGTKYKQVYYIRNPVQYPIFIKVPGVVITIGEASYREHALLSLHRDGIPQFLHVTAIRGPVKFLANPCILHLLPTLRSVCQRAPQCLKIPPLLPTVK
jgi:hypothetical protein